MIEKTSKDYEDIKTAVNLLETPSLTVKIANLIGTPLESALQFLPNGAQEKIHEVVRSALHQSANAALWSLANKSEQTTASNFLHKVMVATTGAIGGAFGFTALAVELPITTTIMLRSIADIARSEGFDLSDFDTKQSCIEVFAFGGPSDKDDATESGYYAARSFMTETTKAIVKELSEIAAQNTAASVSRAMTPAQTRSSLAKIIEAVAARFDVVITEKVAAQAAPVIGGITGAALNTLFTGFYQDTAKGHFIVKRLEKKYGFDVVKTEYDSIRGNKG